MGFLVLSLDSEVAVRLAHEGVPVRVIARATRIPSDEVRRQLKDAQVAGRLPELPIDDWALRAAPLPLRVDDHAQVAQKVFRLTRTQAMVFMLLLRNALVDKYDSVVSPDCFDVHVWRLRRLLQPFGLRIMTLRGQGYQFSTEDRRRAADLISQHITAQTVF